MMFAGAKIWTLVIIFAIAAITDGLDGIIARKFNLKTEFGRKLDMFADRILMLSVVIAVIIYALKNNFLTNIMLVQILLILSREIIAAPFFIIGVMSGRKAFPNARYIAKTTTFLQGFAFPMILLGWRISWVLVTAAFITGIISGIYYARDVFSKKKR